MNSSDPGRVQLPSFEEMMRFARENSGELIDWGEPEEEQAELCAEEGAPGGGEPAQGQPEPEREPQPTEQEIAKQELSELLSRMRQEALQEAQQIREQARQEAVSIEDKTRRQTIKDVRAEMEAERTELQDAFLAAVEALHTAQHELYDLLEPRLLELAIQIAEGILGYTLESDDAAYIAIVNNVLERLPYLAKDLVLHLPAERYRVFSQRPGFIEGMKGRNIEVVSDGTLDRSDCMVSSNVGSIRGGVRTQLSRIHYSVNAAEDKDGKAGGKDG